MPAEWNGKVPTRIFVDESLRILRAASEAKVALKMLGGLAIKVHSLNENEFANRLGRSAEKGQEYSDIDFATYYKSRERGEKGHGIAGLLQTSLDNVHISKSEA